MALAIDFLIVLVTFAGQYDHVVGAGAGNHPGDGGATARHELDAVRHSKTGPNVVKNVRRRFSARVVVRYQDAICQTFNHFGHQRTLAAITVAAAAEQAQQLAFGVRTQRQQYFFQRIGGVRVINHHQRFRTAAQALHATYRTFQFWQHFENFIQRVLKPQQRANRSQHVAQIETPQQAAAQ